jgi:hypothetical protein
LKQTIEIKQILGRGIDFSANYIFPGFIVEAGWRFSAGLIF